MPIPSYVHRFWRALDEHVAHVEPTWWGAVVTNEGAPTIWDTNYARIDVAADLSAREVEADLLPALARVGTDVEHTVHFHPEATIRLLSELSSRGHRLSWDVVMDLVEAPEEPSGVAVEELPVGDELWNRVRSAMGLFGVQEGPETDQLLAIEVATATGGAKRWFGVRDAQGVLVSLAALMTLEGVGYVDNVATFPHARKHGYAGALTARLVVEARSAGASHVVLLADPDAPAVLRMYERLGFRQAGRLAATRGPIPRDASDGFSRAGGDSAPR